MRDAKETADLPHLLVYVAPTTARQFISLSGAQTHLEGAYQRARRHGINEKAPDELPQVKVGPLCGGRWCAAYEVCSSTLPDANNNSPASSAEAPSPRSQCVWCYTLEPLPQEQRDVCQVALGASLRGRSTSLTSAGRLSRQERLLYDILVTPLYISSTPGAVRCIPCAADLRWVAEPAAGVDVLANARAAAERLLGAAPSCASLVYAVAEQHRHRRTCPPIALLPSSDAFTADVYLTAASTEPTRQQEAADDAAESKALAAQLSRRLLHGGGASAPRQAVVWCSGAQAAPVLRHRAALLSQHAREVCRHDDGAPAAPSQPQSTASGGDNGGVALAGRLCAAQQLLDALRPSRPSGGASHVIDAVTLVLYQGRAPAEGQASATSAAATAATTVKKARCSLLQAAVWRVAAFPAPTGSGQGPNVPASTPEPDITDTAWWAAHAAAVAQTLSELSGTTPEVTGVGHGGGCGSGEAAARAPLTVAQLSAWLEVLGLTSAQQAALHDLTYAAVHLAAVRFTSLSRSGHGPAEVAPSALPALHTAAALLRLPADELSAILTSMEASNGDGVADRRVASPSPSQLPSPNNAAARHALNTAGAAQMQRAVVAHLGGILVDAALCLMNRALCGAGGAPHPHDRGATRAVSLVAAALCEEGELKARDAAVQQGSGGGLQAWYGAYVLCHVALSLRSRLPAALRQEACCEGVELEVDTWLDQLHAPSSEPSATPASRAAEVRAVAARVLLPATELQAAWFAETAATTTSAAAYRGDGEEGEEEGRPLLPAMAAVAGALDAVYAQCSQPHTCDSAKTATPPLVSVDAVQRELSRRLEELVGGLRADEEGEGTAAAVTPDKAMPEVSCEWTAPASSADDGARRDRLLTLTFPRGLHPGVHLSVRRLAADVFAAARLCAMGKTPGVHRALRHVRRDCDAFFSNAADIWAGGGDGVDASVDALLELLGRDRRTVHQRLNSVLAVLSPPTSEVVGDELMPKQADYICVVDSVAVPSRVAAEATALAVPGAGGEATTLELWLDAEETTASAAVPPDITQHTRNAHGSHRGSAASVLSLDDALTTHLRDRHPLLLALFVWSRLCHVHVCPVPVFAVEWAMPLLTAHCAWPRVMPSTRNENAATLLRRARALRRHARYRELCLLATHAVPCFRDGPDGESGSGTGAAVLGVSAVFLRVGAVAAASACAAALRDAAVRCLQAAGRGALARRRCPRVAGSPSEPRDAGTATSRQRTSTSAAHGGSGSPAMAARTALEKARDAQLVATAEQRRAALRTSSRQLSHAVGQLQQHWTETLELLEAEVCGAAAQINAFEAQRRAAEDAARLEARRTLRVCEEAWAEVWAESKQPPAHAPAVQDAMRRRAARERARGAAGDDRLAAVAARHLAQLKLEAVQLAEAALLSRVVRSDQRLQTRWVADHVRRQEARLARCATGAGGDAAGHSPVAAAEQQRRREDLQHAGGGSASTLAPTYGAAPVTPASPSATASRGYAAGVDGLVHTRSRSSAAAAPPHPLHETRGATPSPLARGARGAVTGQESIVSIERSTTAADASVLSSEWAVQRDLMALWEASHLTS